MNTVRMFQGIALALLVVFVLPRPASAQEEAEADTIWVEDGKTIVVMGDEGRRITIRSTDDEGASVFFDSDGRDFPRFFEGHPRSFRFRSGTPRILEFNDDFFDGDDHGVAVLSDYLGGLNNVWVDGFGDDIRVGVGESMKGRSEVMRMEMESRRLAQRARRAEGEERARLEGELEEKLQEIFERKQTLRQERIDRLRDDLDELLDAHNERDQNRGEIIERRLNELLGKTSKYDW